MSSFVLAMMVGVSLLLGTCAIFAFMWALKTGQFEDGSKFLDAVHNDGEDELNEAVMLEKRKKDAILRKQKKSS